MSVSRVALLIVVATATVAAQAVPSQQQGARTSEPRPVPASVTSKLLCGSSPPAIPNVPSKQSLKVDSKKSHKSDSFCGPIRGPLYPELAKRAGIKGKLVLEAVIDRNGAVQSLKALEGHPLLVPAALDAAKDWRYKPYRINGKPVAVKTTIIVNFTLQNFQVK